MKKSKLVLNTIILIGCLMGMFILGCIGIEGGHPAATVSAFVLGGIAIADAVIYWDRIAFEHLIDK